MSTAYEMVNSFHRFALEQIKESHSELSIEELFEAWRSRNSTSEEYSENVAAINASIADYDHGERGTPAGKHSAELRERNGIGDE